MSLPPLKGVSPEKIMRIEFNNQLKMLYTLYLKNKNLQIIAKFVIILAITIKSLQNMEYSQFNLGSM
jgi:hypothetical protein